MPTPDFRQLCADYQNLPIEFLFRDEHLTLEVQGKRLELKSLEASRKLGDKIIKIPIGQGTECMQIVESSKMNFAKIVVPHLPDEAFSAFSMLFDIIDDIFESAPQ